MCDIWLDHFQTLEITMVSKAKDIDGLMVQLESLLHLTSLLKFQCCKWWDRCIWV